MTEKKVTDIMLERIKYFINAINNSEYEPNGYEFAIKIHQNGKIISIEDGYFKN